MTYRENGISKEAIELDALRIQYEALEEQHKQCKKDAVRIQFLRTASIVIPLITTLGAVVLVGVAIQRCESKADTARAICYTKGLRHFSTRNNQVFCYEPIKDLDSTYAKPILGGKLGDE